ncbi:putative LLM family oxidoreductase [Pedobacter cryoconitis]|uniref:Putative LLM family oxidoreductase n=1 Tax=Pedobacter cryoconitis TaxID=188932 RepID=A0A7W8YNR4_9SPHI|nr:LLM class flavin-dependent oxidoreductase [Pedobacter cryoconitis]MBB5619032.1 putative LLM family oxidoreductase [Pedobacter cryoconitis]MBB5644329.1 putative LLM family oxidoreductase [Pedobacter cryoconitis]
MELGISMFGDLRVDPITNKFQPAQQRLGEIIEEIKLMDELGLDYFGIGEHHRPDFAVSSPEILLAAAAVVTKNIKLGSAVSVLSSADPVKLYQNFAMVDLLSNGRAELMAGRGSFIESFPLFGNNLTDYNELFTEKLDLLLKINQEETITWKGKFRPELVNQQVLPRAVDNNLPIWIAVGGTPESVIRAGKLGLPLMIAIIGGSPSQFKPLFNLYREEYQKAGHDMARFQVGIHAHAFFGENADEVAANYYPLYAAQMDRIGKSRGWSPYTKYQFDYGRQKEGALFVGDAEAAIDKILYVQEMFGLTRFAAHMDIGAPSHKDMMKSIEIFGTKIAPKVREALKK